MERMRQSVLEEGAGTCPAPSVASAAGHASVASAMRDVLAGDARPELGAAEQKRRVEAAGNPDAFSHFEESLRDLREAGAQRIDAYVLFASHADALALYQAAREADVTARISPTPRDARASCGVALLVPLDEARRVWGVAQARGVPVENMVALPRQINAHRDRYC